MLGQVDPNELARQLGIDRAHFLVHMHDPQYWGLTDEQRRILTYGSARELPLRAVSWEEYLQLTGITPELARSLLSMPEYLQAGHPSAYLEAMYSVARIPNRQIVTHPEPPRDQQAMSATQAQVPREFRFENISSGDPTVFYPGERWRITIGGPPGAVVRLTGTRDGQPFDVHFGTIPSNGTLVKTGTVSDGDVGRWVEYWYADDNLVGSVTFSVAPVKASQPSPDWGPVKESVPGPRATGEQFYANGPPKQSVLPWVLGAAVAGLVLFNA